MMILGIDVGGSTTKIVGVEDGQIRSAQSIVAADPVTSLFGALGKYIYEVRPISYLWGPESRISYSSGICRCFLSADQCSTG